MNEEKEQVMLALRQCIDKFSDLLVASEQRIDKTNEVVRNMADACTKMNETMMFITEEYCKRIDKLCEDRDKTREENMHLLKRLEQLHEASNKHLQAHYDLVARLIAKEAGSKVVINESNNN